MEKFEKNQVLDMEMMQRMRADISSKKTIKNQDGEEIGHRYFFEGSNGILELDIYDSETVMDKFGHVVYLHRKAKDGTKVFRLKQPVDLATDDAFSCLFEAELKAAEDAAAQLRRERALKAAETRRARKAAQQA